MTMRLLALSTLLLAGCSLAAARPPDLCSLTSTVTDAKLTIGIPDGRTSFREGASIPLLLSFTSAAEKRYRAEGRDDDRGGRSDLETYCLEPEARDPLADYFSTTLSLFVGAIPGPQQLSERPFTTTEELNEWRQPGPGHYRLWAVTLRVTREPSSLNSLRAGGAPVLLRSNTIEFDVFRPDVESRAKQLQEAVTAYQDAAAEPCNLGPRSCPAVQPARRLQFLSTRESTETLAGLFWGANDQPGGWELMFGLFGSPYRAEAITAMQREIDNPDHPITQDFLTVFTKLRLLQIAGGVPPSDPWTDDPVASRKLSAYLDNIEAHEPEVRKAALAATVAALPQKKGRAHATTLVTLATERSDLLDKETAAQIHRQLIAGWSSLPEKTRTELIQNDWPPLDGKEALPILREIVTQPAPHFGNVSSRNKALRRVFNLDPDEGRSLILRELSDPEAQPSLSLVKLLSAAQVRPFAERAAERIVSSGPTDAREWDFAFVEEFADKSDAGPLEAKFKKDSDELPKGGCVPYAIPMLRYFLRVDPQVGATEVQAQLAARKATGCDPTLLEDLGPSLPAVEQLAIEDLEAADLGLSTSAARALGRWGTAKVEPALWARLRRFHDEWPNGVGDLPLTDTDGSARLEALDNLETTLLQSIVSGVNWICGPEKLARLRPITSHQHWTDLSQWTAQWKGSQRWILTPYWDPDDRLTFSVLQYSQLNEQQIRVKLSQMPKGSRLYFQTYTKQQMGSPVSMDKQQAVLQGLRNYAAQFGVTIEEIPRFRGRSSTPATARR